MPPKGYKRPAAAKGGAKKRAKNEVFAQCDDVYSALMEVEHIGEHTKEALAEAVEKSLGVAIEDRHEFQTKVIDMIGTTLDTAGKKLAASLTEIEGKIANAETEKASRMAAQAAAKAAHEEKKADCEAKETALKECEAKAKGLKAELTAAKKEQDRVKRDIAKIEAHKGQYEEAISGNYKVLLEGSWDAAGKVKGMMKKLLPLCKELNLDDSLMSSVSSAVEKKPEERGAFDTVAINQLGDALKQKATELGAAIEAEGPAAAERQAKVDAAQAAFDAAEKETEGASEVAKAAEAAVEELLSSLGEKEQAVADFDEEMQETVDEKDEKVAEIEEFNSGPIKSFEALKARSKIPPPEPEPVAETAETLVDAAAAPPVA